MGGDMDRSSLPAVAAGGSPSARLPTLQRNALRKLFERADFTPEDVLALGYRRLQKAEGIGQKGLATIIAWLKEYGYELRLGSEGANGIERPRKARRNLEFAMQLLRTHGYVVTRPGDEPVGGSTGKSG